MKRSRSITRCVAVALAALVPAVSAFAAGPPASAPQAAAQRERKFDWFEHTQQTLNELKGKLNLTPGQAAAWDTWSSGVLGDARQQLARMKDREQKMAEGPLLWTEGSTPERMAHGIDRLRGELKRMQEHLTQLEAAQARTKTFYDQLDTNQKTIFDLFWREAHYRMVDEMEGVRGP